MLVRELRIELQTAIPEFADRVTGPPPRHH